VSPKLPLPISPEARRDLDEAMAWYEEEAGLGDALFAAVVEALTHGVPLSYIDADDFGEGRTMRRYLTWRFPYTLYVLEAPESPPTIVAVSHHRRRGGYWKPRVLPEKEPAEEDPPASD